MLDYKWALGISASVMACVAHAQTANDPRPEWDRALEQARSMSSDRSRIDFLAATACANQAAEKTKLDIRSSQLTSTIGSAAELIAHSPTSESVAGMAGQMIGEEAAKTANLSATMGFWAALCYDYKRQTNATG